MRTYNRSQHYAVLPVYGHNAKGEAFLHSWDGGASYSPGQSRVYDYRYTEDYFTTNIFTDYSKTINDHYFKAMAGFNAELFKTNSVSGQGDSLKDPNIPYLNMAADRLRASGGAGHTSVAGFFARINYSWKDRYMVELNGR